MATELPRKLGLLDSIAIVIGIVIGGGIFLVPNLVARNLASVPMIMSVWIFAGVVSFFGALACAELGAAFPSTGGQYVFLREAYGPLAGFLCGWSMFTVARTAQVAWMAVTFALYVSYLVPLGVVGSKLVGLGVIALFSWINYRGVRSSAVIQTTFTAAKLLGLAIIIGGVFFTHHAKAAPVSTAPAGFSLSSFGVALIACLLAYDGWVQLSFVAGEIQSPRRNVMLALALGSLVVMAVYLLANIAYLRVLTVPEIAASDHVGATAAERVLGSAGGTLVSLIIMLSILGTLNGCCLTSPRVYFAQAADGLFFRQFAEVHPEHRTPGFAILAQAGWAAVLVLTGSYETLVDYALFATWLFYGLMVAGVIVLRRKRPGVDRPYRMWGYPVTPMLFIAITGWFLVNMLVTRPGPSFAGLALIALGIPVYRYWTRVPRETEDVWGPFLRAAQPVIASSIIRTLARWSTPAPEQVDALVEEAVQKLNDERCDPAYLRIFAASVASDSLRALTAQPERAKLIGGIDRLLTNEQDRDRWIFWLYYRHELTPQAIAAIPSLQCTAVEAEAAIDRLAQLTSAEEYLDFLRPLGPGAVEPSCLAVEDVARITTDTGLAGAAELFDHIADCDRCGGLLHAAIAAANEPSMQGLRTSNAEWLAETAERMNRETQPGWLTSTVAALRGLARSHTDTRRKPVVRTVSASNDPPA